MNDLLSKYKNANIVEKLIYINVVVFIVTLIANALASLFNYSDTSIHELFALPSNVGDFILKPWTLITYGFLHGGFIHLLMNLIVLYYIGNLFLDFFTPKKLLDFYLFGTIFGGLVYLLSYNFFPALVGVNGDLVGASSGVMAIFFGLATYAPNYELKLRFIGYLKLWHLALIFLVLDLAQISSQTNIGGHLAHLGGALYGYLFIKNKSTSTGFSFSNLFKKKSHLKTVHKSTKRKKTKKPQVKTEQQQIDAILDKISKSGYESLSKTEKDLLFKQGKE